MATAENADPAPASPGKVLVYTSLPREEMQTLPGVSSWHALDSSSQTLRLSWHLPGEHRVLIVHTAESPLPSLAKQ